MGVGGGFRPVNAPGGGGVTQEQAYYQTSENVAPSTDHYFAWVPDFGSATLLDLTAPTTPKTKKAGLYIVTYSLAYNPEAGKAFFMELDLDGANEATVASQSLDPADTALGGAAIQRDVTIGWYLAAGKNLRAYTFHVKAAAATPLAGMFVQALYF